MKKRFALMFLVGVIGMGMFVGCGKSGEDAAGSASSDLGPAAEEAEVVTADEPAEIESIDECKVTVFAPTDLEEILQTLAASYNESQPNVTIEITADEGAKLAEKIQDGDACDLFVSDDAAQIEELAADKMTQGDAYELMTDNATQAVYSIVQIKNEETDDAKSTAVADFNVFMQTPMALMAFEEAGYTLSAAE